MRVTLTRWVFGIMDGIRMRDPLAMRRNSIAHASPTFERRFWAKVFKTDTCWIWTAAINNKGYGQISLHSKRLILAHRASWELHNGPIPFNMTLDHLCRNHQCVNPEHLEAVPHAVNVERGNSGTAFAKRTECPSGHPYDTNNTYQYDGRRYCRECNRAQQRKGNSVRAQCHPDRSHRGNGLCNSCYLKAKRARARNNAT
jgi:hypothetical protein